MVAFRCWQAISGCRAFIDLLSMLSELYYYLTLRLEDFQLSAQRTRLLVSFPRHHPSALHVHACVHALARNPPPQSGSRFTQSWLSSLLPTFFIKPRRWGGGTTISSPSVKGVCMSLQVGSQQNTWMEHDPDGVMLSKQSRKSRAISLRTPLGPDRLDLRSTSYRELS